MGLYNEKHICFFLRNDCLLITYNIKTMSFLLSFTQVSNDLKKQKQKEKAAAAAASMGPPLPPGMPPGPPPFPQSTEGKKSDQLYNG